MADLFQEIMDDVRADRIGEAWSKHGRWVIYAAISIVMITAAMVYWKHHQREVAMEYTAHYIDATEALAKGDGATALVSLDKINPPKSSGYYGLVLLKKVQSHQMLGHADVAKKLLGELAVREDTYGDVGKILQGGGGKNIENKNAPLAFSRQEWEAWRLLESGKEKEAAELFQAIASVEKAPPTLRERAQMMVLHLQHGATQ